MPQITRRKAIHLTLAGAAAAITTPRHLPAQEPNTKNAALEALIARIEGPQSPDPPTPDPQKPDPQKLNELTLQDVMKKLGVPGVSVAVIKDFKIHWANERTAPEAPPRFPSSPVPRDIPRISSVPSVLTNY